MVYCDFRERRSEGSISETDVEKIIKRVNERLSRLDDYQHRTYSSV